MQATDNSPLHWLRHYASPEYHWKSTSHSGTTRWSRPIGLVESIFDSDGRYWEGRADISNLQELEIRSSLGREQLRERILLAWTCLRNQHLLLQAKAALNPKSQPNDTDSDRLQFTVDVEESPETAIAEARRHIVFLQDYYDAIDWQDFWRHCQNTKRVIYPDSALATIFVLPLEPRPNGHQTLRFLSIGAHQIWDGLTTSVWMQDLIHNLNCTTSQLQIRLAQALEPSGVATRLPMPQEALYPPITGSRAKRHWFWLLTRILRHVRKPLQAGFSNPLYRPQGARQPVALSPTYEKAGLDYTAIPPFNTVLCTLAFPAHQTRTLHRLCREAGASIGAGCFALVALTMMEMQEQLEPDIALADRKPFISGFPLNPRAFFDYRVDPDSCMLAFSDGIALPFLSKTLPFQGRLRLAARQAHRQLAAFTKRSGVAKADGDVQFMLSRGAGRVLQTQYVNSVERSDAMLPQELRSGVEPQGAYPPRPNGSNQTCGVSSVGRNPWLKRGMYDLHIPAQSIGDGGGGEGEFVADFRRSYSCVRAREGEFLVGIGGSDEGLWANISIDASTVDLELVGVWREKILRVLEDKEVVVAAKL
ncbi:hypothetical protein LTR62_005117 [Meristemomyces frigidus]|uniref:Uncharacterized protein n=1 Tax=Meristemomyces frigidus TaxID=1508187 RepID=A0AAN7TR34_9PEZI|nr:hypothetical protein LTR62_005117 [Meristemomyces frigidus]